jgi:hypothetical protein
MSRPITFVAVLLILLSVATSVSRGEETAKSPPKPKRFVALAMHPMWLIIKEDTVCTERWRPWGAPSIGEYAQRVGRNLKSLESNPKAMLNYDFSAGELEDMKAMYPDMAKRIRAAVERGQLGMVNGTYSQPHLHTLSLEASVRQFQFGTRSILDNFGYRVRTYAMQEPGYTDQTPQILKAFGYQYFHRAFYITQQPPLPGQTVAGNEPFCRWTGLDGTTILSLQPAAGVEIRAPDMEEFGMDADCDYVVLDKFEDAKAAQWTGPTPKVRTYIPWAYIEGTHADELSRNDVAAETALVQMETLKALIPSADNPKSLPDITPMWKTWLLAQHHDAYWTGGSELRPKVCGWLKEIIGKAAQACSAMLSRAFPSAAGGKRSIVLAAVYPKKHRGVAAVPWSGDAPATFQCATGKPLPAQAMPTGPNKGKLLVPFDFAGAGCQEQIAGGSAAPSSKPETIAADWKFTNPYYTAEFHPDGSIKSIRTAQGAKILDGDVPAATLSATVIGVPRQFEAGATTAVCWRGPVADVVESSANFPCSFILSPTFPVIRRLILYHDLPWFEMEIECRFEGASTGDYHFKGVSLGDFFDDTMKLSLQWPVQPGAPIVQGIGGGAIAADEPATVFYPVNWLDLPRGGGGLSMIEFGTLKHVVRNGKLYAVLAWGGETNHFNNRVCGTDWLKALDLRLNGVQTFRFAFYPHDKDWRAAGVPDVAMSLLRPPVGVARLCPPDAKPTSKTLLAIDGNLIPTSVFAEGNRLVCRVYEPYGKKPEFSLEHLGKATIPRLCDVADKPVDTLRPWAIANLVLETPPAGPDKK